MLNTKTIDKKPFNIKDKIGYLFGDLGNDFTFILSSSFLLKFYTDVMGVPPWIVGLVMTVARFAVVESALVVQSVLLPMKQLNLCR